LKSILDLNIPFFAFRESQFQRERIWTFASATWQHAFVKENFQHVIKRNKPADKNC